MGGIVISLVGWLFILYLIVHRFLLHVIFVIDHRFCRGVIASLAMLDVSLLCPASTSWSQKWRKTVEEGFASLRGFPCSKTTEETVLFLPFQNLTLPRGKNPGKKGDECFWLMRFEMG